jgi:hypothetical protein
MPCGGDTCASRAQVERREAALAGRASPPLLFGLAPRGVFRASRIAAGAVGSYPTFSPLPNAAGLWKACRRFPSRPATGTHLRRRSILCGTVRGRTLASPAPWRYQARCPAVSGLSSRRRALQLSGRRSPGLPANYSPSVAQPSSSAAQSESNSFVLWTRREVLWYPSRVVAASIGGWP